MKKSEKTQRRIKDEHERLVRNSSSDNNQPPCPPIHRTLKPPVVTTGTAQKNDRSIDGSSTSKTSNSTRLTILNDGYS